MLTPDQKGSIAESEIVAAAARQGISVFKPLMAGERYDLIFDTGASLLRVQCKWARFRNGVVTVRNYSSRRTAEGFSRRLYTSREADVLAVYCAELDRCFLLPLRVIDGRPAIRLRATAARNNQRLGVNWADDFDFDRLDWKSSLGP